MMMMMMMRCDDIGNDSNNDNDNSKYSALSYAKKYAMHFIFITSWQAYEILQKKAA